MYKKLETIDEKTGFMAYYFRHIGDANFVDSLNEFKNKTGFGIDCVRVLFHIDFEEWEEYRCREEEVALIMDYPAAEEDTIGYLDFCQFYIQLLHQSNKYIQKYPEQGKKVMEILGEIQVALNVRVQ